MERKWDDYEIGIKEGNMRKEKKADYTNTEKKTLNKSKKRS